MPAALATSGRFRLRRPRRTALLRRWVDLVDDPVLLCECADGVHTC